jgi:hypothetical protein
VPGHGIWRWLRRRLRFRRGRWSCTRNSCAATSVSLQKIEWAGLVGSIRTATRETFGTTSLSNSNRLRLRVPPLTVSPVRFPPGRARLATSPVSTGLTAAAITMGIVVVACFAASAAWVAGAKIKSTFSRTNSAASSGSRSAGPPVVRNSIGKFWPSMYPSSRILRMKLSHMGF